jgi:hypothetical protein
MCEWWQIDAKQHQSYSNTLDPSNFGHTPPKLRSRCTDTASRAHGSSIHQVMNLSKQGASPVAYWSRPPHSGSASGRCRILAGHCMKHGDASASSCSGGSGLTPKSNWQLQLAHGGGVSRGPKQAMHSCYWSAGSVVTMLSGGWVRPDTAHPTGMHLKSS